MGNQLAERVFSFMGNNFSGFVFCVFSVLLAVTGVFIIIKKLIYPTPLLPSTNRLNEIVRAQLEQEVRTRHIVFQRNRRQRSKYKKYLENFSMEVSEENLEPIDSLDTEIGRKSREESKEINDLSVSVDISKEQLLHLPYKKLCAPPTDSTNKASSKNCTMTCNSIQVPSQCRICLENYLIGDKVAWSSNPNCLHVFHEECILTWLSKIGEGSCPLCRQTFCQEVDDDIGFQCGMETDGDINFDDDRVLRS